MKLVISVIFSIVVWGSIIYSGYRIFTKDTIEASARKSTYSALNIALCAFIFRTAVYLISAALIYYGQKELSLSSFFERWQRWDANNYIRIAQGWYTGYTENGDFLTLVFFPLYPLLARILYLIVPNINIALMEVSCIAYAVGCGYMYKLVQMDYSDKTALNSVIWISVFPFSLFFGALMTESVFFMTAAMSFYYIRRHSWFLAGICGALCAFSRMIGIFIIVPAFIEWFDYYKPFQNGVKAFFKSFAEVLPVCMTAVGLLGYLFINYCITGNPFMFMEYQNKYWNHTTCYFSNTIGDIFKYMISPETDILMKISVWIPSAVIFTSAAAALIYSAIKMRNMYTVYLAGYIVINCSVTWLISGPRYMSAAIPLFITAGIVTSEKKLLNICLLSASFILMIIYIYRYLFNMQVM